jgi:hypothetical protein
MFDQLYASSRCCLDLRHLSVQCEHRFVKILVPTLNDRFPAWKFAILSLEVLSFFFYGFD